MPLQNLGQLRSAAEYRDSVNMLTVFALVVVNESDRSRKCFTALKHVADDHLAGVSCAVDQHGSTVTAAERSCVEPARQPDAAHQTDQQYRIDDEYGPWIDCDAEGDMND